MLHLFSDNGDFIDYLPYTLVPLLGISTKGRWLVIYLKQNNFIYVNKYITSFLEKKMTACTFLIRNMFLDQFIQFLSLCSLSLSLSLCSLLSSVSLSLSVYLTDLIFLYNNLDPSHWPLSWQGTFDQQTSCTPCTQIQKHLSPIVRTRRSRRCSGSATDCGSSPECLYESPPQLPAVRNQSEIHVCVRIYWFILYSVCFHFITIKWFQIALIPHPP